MQTEIRNLLDCHVIGSDGQSIGKVGQVYLSDRTGEPEWVTVRTGFFGMKQTFVPLTNARRSGDEIRVPFDKEMIKGAPNIDVDGRLSLEEEAELYRYYGMQPSNIPSQRTPMGERQARTAAGEQRIADERGRRGGMTGQTGQTTGQTGQAGRPRGRDVGDRDIDMTTSEERLRIGKESRESGHVRLRKYVETENVQEKVPLSHEEVVIEREPIKDGEPGTYEIGEDEQQITLHEERAVIGKETRPVEHIRVHKERVQHEETVEGQVRRERLEVDEDGSARERTRNRRGDDLPPKR
ncbi:DUF2382 domain-containing protein [Nonomuraea spiralis]|uniref:DUF2382 domain-containing protein n=1 Tax=Nonomuraea spiralis TaxID=46182 RepID=A0ABV5I5D8_9ACTN|nr:PRC and DUF2382 domain-containing protein [Nonomuraea spiralis]